MGGEGGEGGGSQNGSGGGGGGSDPGPEVIFGPLAAAPHLPLPPQLFRMHDRPSPVEPSSAGVLSFGWHPPLSFPIETPTEWRGGCSRMTEVDGA